MTDPQLSPVGIAACAVGLMVDDLLAQLKATDSQCHEAVMKALTNGATISATTSMALSGLLVIDVVLITPQGERLPLASHETPVPKEWAQGTKH